MGACIEIYGLRVVKDRTIMTLLDTGLKLDTSKKFILEPIEGVTPMEVYKTKPAKYIVSVDAYERIGNECQVSEMTHSRRRRVHA